MDEIIQFIAALLSVPTSFDLSLAISEAAAAALITAGATIAGTGIQVGANAVSNRKSYKYTKRLTKFQNKLARENWELENAYNTPAAQRARMEAAGINPNVAFGDGVSASTGNAGAIDTPTPAQFEYQSPLKQVGVGMQQLSELPMVALNYQNMAEQIEQTKARTAGFLLDNLHKALENEKLGKSLPYVVDEIVASLRETNSRSALNQANAAVANVNSSLLKEKMAGVKLDNQQKEKFLTWFDRLQQAKLDESAARIKDLNASAASKYAGIEVSKAQAAKLREEANKLNYEWNFILPKQGALLDNNVELSAANVEKANAAVSKMQVECEHLARQDVIAELRLELDQKKLDWDKEKFDKEVEQRTKDRTQKYVSLVVGSAAAVATGGMSLVGKAVSSVAGSGNSSGYEISY